MSNNKSKDKGSRFERDSAKDLSVNGGLWKRIAGSGSLGSNLGQPELMGDVHGSYPFFKRKIKAEGKFGYGNSKRMTIQREWITKNREQANLDNAYPCLLLKFNDVTGGDIGSAKLICFNYDVWNQMMLDVQELYQNYLKLVEKDYLRKEKENNV